MFRAFGIAVMIVMVTAGCVNETPLSVTPGVTLSDAEVSRAEAIFAQATPSASEIAWLESMNVEQRQLLIEKLAARHGVSEELLKSQSQVALANQIAGGWYHQRIPKANIAGTGCTSVGFWNSSGECGTDWPRDKLYYFPCSNVALRGRMRIWSTDWRSNWALGSGVDARVFDSYILACVGYWSLVVTGTNPYTMMYTTRIVW